MNYATLQKIVWNFADAIRDKGKGNALDYASITLPTLAVKRILDTVDEKIDQLVNDTQNKKLLALEAISMADIFEEMNNKLGFFDADKVKNNVAVMGISWENIMTYADNPNGEQQTLTVYGLTYTTYAKHFVELMLEVADFMTDKLAHVFVSFQFRHHMQRQLLPQQRYLEVCHGANALSLSNFNFSINNVPSDMFGDVYMDLIGRFAEDSGKKGGEFFTPSKLVEESVRFLDIDGYVNQHMVQGHKKTLVMADPTAGSDTFLIYAAKAAEKAKNDINIEFYAQEKGEFQHALGALNMAFHGYAKNYNIDMPIQAMDVIDEYNKGIGQKRGKVDIVCANPPYGLSDYGYDYVTKNATEPRWMYGIPKKSDGEFAFMNTIMDLLNSQGRAVVVMPLGTLFRDSSADLRGKYLEADMIEGIVTLPGNMFLTTSIPVCLWIVNKNKAEADKGKVFMVNASKDFVKTGKFNDWQSDKAVDTYLKRDVVDGYAGYVDVSVLKDANYNLSVQRYFSQAEEKEVIDIAALMDDVEKLEQSLNEKKAFVNGLIAQMMKAE